MSKRNAQMTLLDRFRRSSPLRVLFLLATLLASQNSLACVFEGFASQQTELSIVAIDAVQVEASTVPGENSADGCCGSGVGCEYCGGCCSFAVSLRASAAHFFLVPIAYANLGFATAAPTLWTPPALLRPPINAI